MASNDSNIKMVKIVNIKGGDEPTLDMGGLEGGGAASKAATRKRDGGGRRKTQKILQVASVTKLSGGAQAASPGTAVQLAASRAPPVDAPGPVVGVDSAATQKGAPLTIVPETKGGGSTESHTPVKVVLTAAKKKKPGVILAAQATHAKPLAVVAAATAATHSKGGGTRKAGVHKARKIKVSMKTLRKKIHRAKTIRKSAEGTNLEQIKKELQKAGIIKAESKAPESILRQMYADFMTLKSRAL